MKVLVTGSTGQLAQSLVERARDHPHVKLVAIGRPRLDLEQPGSAERVITEERPHVVINAAAYTAVDQAEDEPELAFRINAEAAGEVAAAAAAVGARVIQLSTDYVFDGLGEAPYDEQALTGPQGEYGRSKVAGEELVRSANSDHVIVRTAWVYSPFGKNFVKTMIAAALTRRTLSVVDDQVGSPSSALDLADGLLAMLNSWNREPDRGLGQTLHLAGAPPISWCAFARAVMAECRTQGLPSVPIEPILTEQWSTRAARPAMSALNSGKFVETFGFRMPPLERSLAAVIGRVSRTVE